MFGKLLRILGLGSPGLEISPEPFPPECLPSASPPPEPAEEPAAILCREEIVDARCRIAGYRFIARRLTGSAAVDAGSRLELLRAEAIANFAQRRLAVIPIAGEEWLMHDFKWLAAPGTVFLIDAPASVGDRDGWFAVLADMRSSGAKIALTGAAMAIPGALDAADLLLLDFGDYSLEAFEGIVARTRQQHPSLQLLVENIQSWPEHRLSLARGAHYSLGGFATRSDEEDTREKLNQSRLVLIELLRLMRQDADVTALAEVAKRDPAVALKVVSMANSPASGLSSPVASLDQAVLVLGRASLYRWIAISMFRVGGGDRDEELLELALFRGRFLEIVAQEDRPKHESDELFLVGLLSLLDILLGLPFDKIIAGMSLPRSVTSVLVDSEGPYACYLMLVMAIEHGRMEHVAKLAAHLGLDAAGIESKCGEARLWVEEALSMA